jgi:hypothetical protein
MHRINSPDLFKDNASILNALVEHELKKEAQLAKGNEIDENKVLEDFENFQNMITANPKMRNLFLKLQKKFANNESIEGVDQNFIQGVMLLDLGVK